MYPFYGEIVVGYFNSDNGWEEQSCAVFLFADDYTSAMSKMEHYYGDELVELTYLAPFEETTVGLVEMSVEAGRAFIKDAYQYELKKKDPVPEKYPAVIEWDPRTPFPQNAPVGTVIKTVYNLEDITP